ncbi:MAG: GNAT family N-acetyltransferase [Candidatus Pacearchaeota archaeon]
MKIRKAKKTDLKEYLNLRREDIQECAKLTHQKIKVPVKENTVEFMNIIKSKKGIIFFAEDKKLIGYIIGETEKNIWGEKGYINYFFVKQEFRKKGVGSDLLKNFISELKKRKITRCNLHVDLENKKAIKLYERFNFKQDSILMKLK